MMNGIKSEGNRRSEATSVPNQSTERSELKRPGRSRVEWPVWARDRIAAHSPPRNRKVPPRTIKQALSTYEEEREAWSDVRLMPKR
jgi:hypothetical protein